MAKGLRRKKKCKKHVQENRNRTQFQELTAKCNYCRGRIKEPSMSLCPGDWENEGPWQKQEGSAE